MRHVVLITRGLPHLNELWLKNFNSYKEHVDELHVMVDTANSDEPYEIAKEIYKGHDVHKWGKRGGSGEFFSSFVERSGMEAWGDDPVMLAEDDCLILDPKALSKNLEDIEQDNYDIVGQAWDTPYKIFNDYLQDNGKEPLEHNAIWINCLTLKASLFHQERHTMAKMRLKKGDLIPVVDRPVTEDILRLNELVVFAWKQIAEGKRIRFLPVNEGHFRGMHRKLNGDHFSNFSFHCVSASQWDALLKPDKVALTAASGPGDRWRISCKLAYWRFAIENSNINRADNEAKLDYLRKEIRPDEAVEEYFYNHLANKIPLR